MKHSFKSIVAVLIVVLSFCTSGLLAQGKINVTWKPFQVFANDSSRVYLKYKLPQLICSGIQYNSILRNIVLPELTDQATGNADISYKTTNTDSSYLLKYKRLFESANIKYLLEGAIYIENQQFFIVINGTNFKDRLIPYQSEKRPVSELADVIDKSCENINYQIRRIELQLLGPASISILNFNMNYSGSGSNLDQDDFYRQNFLSLYLQSNLKSSKDFLVIPDNFNSNNSSFRGIDTLKHRVIVSGNITVSSKGNCTIQPVVYFTRLDSIVLQPIIGNVAYKDRFLGNVLSNIQTTLDATVINGDTKAIRQFIENKHHRQSDFENAFSNACDSNQFALAYYYAEQLSIAPHCDTTRGVFLKGKLLYKENDFPGAIGYFSNYVKNKKDDAEANYLLGLSFAKTGRNSDAIKLLTNIDQQRSPAKDVFYQLGLCYYSLDSVKQSLENFKKQIAVDETVHDDIYYFMALCYQDLKDWEPGLQCIRKLYLQDSTSQVNKTYASEYFYDYATSRFSNKDYKNAYDYYEKSFQFNKSEYSLYATLKAGIYLNKPENDVANMIKEGLRSKIFINSIIYSDVANIYDGIRDSTNAYIPTNLKQSIRYCKQQLPFCSDSLSRAYTFRHLGSDFFRLHALDSALYYYKKAMEIEVPVTNLEDTYINYLNLAELQLTLFDVDGSLKTLSILDTKFHIKKEGSLNIDLQSYLILYYFYNMECKTIKNENYDHEAVQLQKTVKANSYKRPLENWSFRTFYNWIVNNPQVDDGKKKVLMDNLCPLLPLSADDDLVCSNKDK